MPVPGKKPWLLDPLGGTGSIRHYADRAGRHWGELAQYIQRSSGQLELVPPAFENPEIRNVWDKAVACDLLLLAPKSRAKFANLLADGSRPLGDSGPTAGDLQNSTVAAVMIPLAGKGECIKPMRLWAFTDLRHTWRSASGLEQFQDNRELLHKAGDQGVVFYLENPRGIQISGNSWQLAAGLLLNVLDKGSESMRIELAANWIATGALQADKVQTVVLKNKLEGSIESAGTRAWLVPGVDEVSFEKAIDRAGGEVPVFYCNTLLEAYRKIAGYGARPVDEKKWPRKVAVMHTLIGSNICTSLAPILYALPDELHIWHSDSQKYSVEPARRLEALVKKYLPQLANRITLHEMPSSSIARAEDELRPFMNKASEPDIYFNVTSGNRLMMLAVNNMAYMNDKVQLIYREIGDEGLGYVNLWHKNGHFHTSTLVPGRMTPELQSTIIRLLKVKPGEFEQEEVEFSKAVKLILRQMSEGDQAL